MRKIELSKSNPLNFIGQNFRMFNKDQYDEMFNMGYKIDSDGERVSDDDETGLSYDKYQKRMYKNTCMSLFRMKCNCDEEG